MYELEQARRTVLGCDIKPDGQRFLTATPAAALLDVFGGSNGANWPHVAAHVIAGFLVSAFAWLIGSAILFVTRKLKPA